MASVAPGHGGDSGGDPPGGGDQQSRPDGSGGRMKRRGESRNVEMRKLWKKNRKRPFPIEFDDTQYIDYYMSGNTIRRSEVNTQVRAKQVHQSLHSRTAYTRYHIMNRDPVSSQPPSMLDVYAQKHSRGGVFTHPDLAENHLRMVELKDAQPGSQHPLNEEEILKVVSGEHPEHVRGVGRMVSSTSSSSASESSQRMYTHAEVNALLVAQHSKVQNELFAIRDQNRVIRQVLSKAGLINLNPPSSSSQFIPTPDLDRDEEHSDSDDDN